MSAWWNTDHELPVSPEPRTCLLCGLEATSATIWLKPAWWREAVCNEEGRYVQVTTIPRCLDIDACRARVAALGEMWLLLDRGAQLPDLPRHRQAEPLDQPLSTPPDAEPEEADRDYF